MKEMPLCPVCGTRLVYPDKPLRGRTSPLANGETHALLRDVRCVKCPAECTVDEELMFVRSFVPNQPLKVVKVS